MRTLIELSNWPGAGSGGNLKGARLFRAAMWPGSARWRPARRAATMCGAADARNGISARCTAVGDRKPPMELLEGLWAARPRHFLESAFILVGVPGLVAAGLFILNHGHSANAYNNIYRRERRVAAFIAMPHP